MTTEWDSDDELIRQIVLTELEKTKVPDVNEAWKRFLEKYGERLGLVKKKRFWQKRGFWASAVVLVIMTTAIFFKPVPATAWGEKFIRSMRDIFVGETTKNRQISYSVEGNPQPGVLPPPEVKVIESSPIIDEEISFAEAERRAPYPIATPTYLPKGMVLNNVKITQLGTNSSQIRLEYIFEQKYLKLTQFNIIGPTGMGKLYDTDDVKLKDIEVNGAIEQLFVYKDGSYSLDWPIRGLHLELRSNLPENEVVKISHSIK